MLVDIVTEATGSSPAAVSVSPRPSLGYQSNRLYDAWAGDRHLIVKEFLKPDEFHDAPLREFRALELLAPLDIAPQPVSYRPFAGPPLGPTVLYEYMAGQMWDRRRPTAAELAQLADLWLQINDLPTENLWLSRGQERSFEEIEAHFRTVFESYAAWVEAEFPPGREAADLCLALLQRCRPVAQELRDHRPQLCFCRSDPRFANVIRRPDGRLGLVDWEDSGLRDPARDLADIVTHPNQEDVISPQEWQAFLNPYLAVRGQVDPALSHRMRLYLAVFALFWLAVLIQTGLGRARQGQLVGWASHSMPINHRLRRYLARGMAWPEADFSSQEQALASVTFFPT
jgi:aminoglycoside phosphotransferase (APT) family kinase protein